MTDIKDFDFDDEIYFEEATTPIEAVNMANYALSTLDMIDMDDEKLTDTRKRTLMRVKKQCIKLLAWGVQEMHDSIFEAEVDNG
jgi:hypothetical protein